jgi:hypothetical protein
MNWNLEEGKGKAFLKEECSVCKGPKAQISMALSGSEVCCGGTQDCRYRQRAAGSTAG